MNVAIFKREALCSKVCIFWLKMLMRPTEDRPPKAKVYNMVGGFFDGCFPGAFQINVYMSRVMLRLIIKEDVPFFELLVFLIALI